MRTLQVVVTQRDRGRSGARPNCKAAALRHANPASATARLAMGKNQAVVVCTMRQQPQLRKGTTNVTVCQTQVDFAIHRITSTPKSCSQNAHRNSRTGAKTGHHRVPNAMKRKDRPSLDCAHNPKVGGSNPSPAIEGRLNKPPFLFELQTALFIQVLQNIGGKIS